MGGIGIIGAGIVGLQTALAAVRKGYDVFVYEQSGGVGFGASGHNAGVIHVLQPPFINRKARLARKANPLYDELSETLGFKLVRLPLYLLYRRGVEKYLGIASSAALRAMGFKVRLADMREIVSSCPDVNPVFGGGIRVDGYATVIPLEVLNSIKKYLEENGVHVSFSARVESIGQSRGKPCILLEESREECFERVIITAGPGVSGLVGENDIPRIGFYKGVMVRVDLDCNAILARVRSSTRSRETKGGGVIPWPDGTVLLGPTFSPTDNPWDTSYTREEVENTVSLYKPLLSYRPEVRYVDAGTRSKNLSRDEFYVRRRDNIIITAGIDSPGFTASPLIAQDILMLAGL